MQYEFITDLKEEEYNNLTKDINYIHYKSDILWNKLNNMYTVIYVALKKKNKFIGCAKIELNIDSLFVSNINILKNDDIVLSLLINEIKLLAHKLNIFEINIINIDFKDIKISKKKIIQKFSLLNLYNKNKFYRKDYFKKLFKEDSTNLLTIKSKITKKDIERLIFTINNWNIKLNYDLNELIKIYKNKCIINIEYLDLVYYRTQAINSKVTNETIDELIDLYGEEMIVGFSIIIFPNNKNTAYCLSLNTIDSFKELNIRGNLILETINTTIKKKYSNIIFTDYIHNSKEIYEFNYKIITNKFKYLVNSMKKRR